MTDTQSRSGTTARPAPCGTGAATLISAARVITRPEAAPVEPGAVLVQGSAITAVGAVDDLAARAPTVARVDFPSATVIPGLVNAHAHLAFDVTTDPRPALERCDVDTIARSITANARSVIDGGSPPCATSATRRAWWPPSVTRSAAGNTRDAGC